MEIVRYMQKQPAFTFEELDRHICMLFPGFLTPPAELVRACLESYGEMIPTQPGIQVITWRMRPSEMAAARKADLQQMRASLIAVGERLGYTINEHGSIMAWEKHGNTEWWFGLMASSIFSRYVLAASPEQVLWRVLVLPGSRARLVSFKLRRDPRLEAALNQPGFSWRFLKFRHLREISRQDNITPSDWAELIDEDPLTEEATQMQLFQDKS